MLLFDGSFKTFAANTTLSVFMTNYYNIYMQDMTAILKPMLLSTAVLF